MKEAPYGSWASPLSPELIAGSTLRLGQTAVDGEDVYWLEGRPSEGGRNVLMRKAADGNIADVTPANFNVRTVAHEYGGGAYTVAAGIVYFVNYQDQQIYKQTPGGAPQKLTQASQHRFADLLVDERRNRLICVMEEHGEPGSEPLNTIASIALSDGAVDTLVAGNDFYAYPRLNPAGTLLSWMSWNHPHMPWDESAVWTANIGMKDGQLSNFRKIAGQPGEAVFQPQWSPTGVLHYVSDRSGWWNIYAHPDYEDPYAVVACDAEFGLPLWNFAMSTYDFLPLPEGLAGDGQEPASLVCAYCREGIWHLAVVVAGSGELTAIKAVPAAGAKGAGEVLPYCDYSSVHVGKEKTGNSKVVALASAPDKMLQVVEIALDSTFSGRATTLKVANPVVVEDGYISRARAIEFPSPDGGSAFAFYYPPTNVDYKAPSGTLPPLLVKTHGGPTAARTATFDLGIQYWTSRGFAVCDVNYGGSTGYGRRYRQRLHKQWGVVDVDDCCSAAEYLVEANLADKHKLAISGGSAGGYTVLCALAFRNVFRAGTSYYGISDLAALAHDTHKFEARYCDWLVGPPSDEALYRQRSPIYSADKLNCPVLFLQGDQDKVVPPNQSELMYQALVEKRLPTAFILFPGEQHGFRQAKTIKAALEAELYFLGQVFRFVPADALPELPIANAECLEAQARSR